MVEKLVTRSQFARMTSVSAAAITKACGSDDLLKPAVVGKRIDLNHSSAVSYMYAHPLKVDSTVAPPPPVEEKPHKRGYAARNQTKKQNREPITDPEDMLHSIPEDIRAFADMSLRDLVHRFGTDVAFLDWLKATKAIEDINEKRLKNAQTRGELVSRHLMKIGVIEPIDAAHIKLLTDGAKTIARRVTAMTAAGKSVEDCEKFVADQMTSFIRPIKAKVARALKNA